MLITSGSKRVNVKLEMPEYGLVELMKYVTHFSYLFLRCSCFSALHHGITFVCTFFSRIVHSYVIKGNQSKKKNRQTSLWWVFVRPFFTWLGLNNILLCSFLTYWLRNVVSHLMWTQKNKVCSWSDCSWPKLQHRCSHLWFRKMF